MNNQPARFFHGRRAARRRKYTALIAQQGGRTRKHKYWRDLLTFVMPVLMAIALQTIVYSLLASRGGTIGWKSILLTLAALSLVPVFTAVILAAFRRHGALLVASSLIGLVLYGLAIALLSAFRVHVSYLAIATCMPIGIGIMAYANLRFHQVAARKIALAPITGGDDEDIQHQLGASVRILPGPDADISDLDLLLIDPRSHHTQQWSALLSECYLRGIEIMPWTRYIELRYQRLHIPSFDISHIAYTPSQLLYARTKRGFDLVVVILSLPLTLPLALLVAAYIYARDGQPVLFVQLRRGFGSVRFRMYKFRTMYKGTAGGATAKEDNRIIPGCGILRKLRLDELPQLYNIFVGDMSIIGPRPEAVDLVKWYRREIPEWDYRTLVLPGITGWAQVNSGYTSNPQEARVKLAYDLYYIKHLSFDLDLQIFFKTVKTVLFGIGAR